MRANCVEIPQAVIDAALERMVGRAFTVHDIAAVVAQHMPGASPYTHKRAAGRLIQAQRCSGLIAYERGVWAWL